MSTVVTRRNKLTDPGFETGVNGFTAYTGVAAPTRVLTTPFAGTGRLEAVGNGTSTAPRVQVVSNTSFVPGEKWTLNCRLRRDGTIPSGGNAFLAIRWQTTSVEVLSQAIPAFTPDGTGYMYVAVTGLVPSNTSGAAILNIGFSGFSSVLTSSGTIGVDQVDFERGGDKGYFDGNSPGASWVGAVNNSESIIQQELDKQSFIFSDLNDQGFTTGTLADREYARLLGRLGLTPPQKLSLYDMYSLAGERPRLY